MSRHRYTKELYNAFLQASSMCYSGLALSEVISIPLSHDSISRWLAEVYHREVKQTCGIERCQARIGRAQRNHIFLDIAAWFEQHKRRITQKTMLYQQNWDVIKNAFQEQIKILMLQAT